MTDDNDTRRSWPWTTCGGSVRTSSGELVGIDSALRIVTVYACVPVLAETVASP